MKDVIYVMERISCASFMPRVDSIIVLICSLSFYACSGNDMIKKPQSIKDPESITSKSSIFKLGFFSPLNSTNRYVGIWYNDISDLTVIWVANRDNPLNDSSGIFSMSQNGNLQVLNGKNEIVWSSNVSSTAFNRTAQLLDTGNLVIREADDTNNGNFTWESFKHPSNSFIAKMKLTTNLVTMDKQLLTSWKSPSDPSFGRFSAGIDPLGIPQVYIWDGNKPHWRSGPWNGQIFIGIPDMSSAYLDGVSLVDDQDGIVYMTYTYANKSIISVYRLNYRGNLMEIEWNYELNKWQVTWLAQNTECDFYGKCGPFGICNSQAKPICSCLRGFEPKYIKEWNRGNWSGGCVRRSPLNCDRSSGKRDGFLKLKMIKIPDFAEYASIEESDCERLCFQNCSCMAYAYNIGVGCMSWSVPLVDIQKFSGSGFPLFVRLAYSELDKTNDMEVIIAITVSIGIVVTATCAYLFWRWMAKQRGRAGMSLSRRRKKSKTSDVCVLHRQITQAKLQDLPLFSFNELATATNSFHNSNKLGQGGFGPVYRGMLEDGREIAVKRLSKASGQGLEEFMNEVAVISKLQHRNLVRLLGCCIEGEENILIYEYMPNKSLDAFLFDPQKKHILDWKTRFNIIDGIGRGLLYLHRDSRLRIIHRDLKASNILLDGGLNPKISDFGTARIFGGNQDQANTLRIVGTCGYISPEYAVEGRFSEKSDVFSFGVLLLEIVSGRKITHVHGDGSLSLLGLAWKLWNEGNLSEFMDAAICHSSDQAEIQRFIHVGLLCVEELATDRPTISTVLSMLSSEKMDLPIPKQPAFTIKQTYYSEILQRSQIGNSINAVTFTVFQGR